MNVNQKIIRALKNFGYPVVPDVYEGNSDTYFVFNYSTIPDDFADDAPGAERYLVQVHFFCAAIGNVLAIRTKIKQNLFASGFSWPDEINASDHQDGQHYVFECEAVCGVILDG